MLCMVRTATSLAWLLLCSGLHVALRRGTCVKGAQQHKTVVTRPRQQACPPPDFKAVTHCSLQRA